MHTKCVLNDGTKSEQNMEITIPKEDKLENQDGSIEAEYGNTASDIRTKVHDIDVKDSPKVTQTDKSEEPDEPDESPDRDKNIKTIIKEPNTPLDSKTTKVPKTKRWTFKKYCEKYDSVRVIKKFQQKLRNGEIKTKDVLAKVVDAMDPTDDLMSLKIEPMKANTSLHPDMNQAHNTDSSEESANETRRFPAWGPKVHKEYILPYDTTKVRGGFDAYYIRARLLELMKQAIYNVRVKMIPMQMLRSQFIKNSLYKMGWLFSKTDNKCKVYSKVAWLAWRACMNFRQRAGGGKKFTILDILPTEERLLNLRLEIELLVDLVLANERRAQRVVAKYRDHRAQHFKFID